MSNRNLPGNRLRLESLERRLMLDGNVAVDVVDGDLMIRGDAAANWIDIQPYRPLTNDTTDRPAVLPKVQYVVTGQRDTTINGEKEVIVGGVTGDIRVALGRGDDSVNIHGIPQWISRKEGPEPGVEFAPVQPLSVPNDLTISGSAGNDRVMLDTARVGGNLRIHTASGDDYVHVGGVQVGENLAIRTGRGEDFVTIRAAYNPMIMGPDANAADAVLERPSSFVGGRAWISTGAMADHVMIRDTTVAEDLIVGTGFGDDSLLITGMNVGDDMRLNTSFGDDKVGVSRTSVADRFTLNTGFGDDIVERQRYERPTTDEPGAEATGAMAPEVMPQFGIMGLKANTASIQTGWGDDCVELLALSIAERLSVRLGPGQDRLRAIENVVEGFAYLDGGFGKDEVNEDVKEVNKFAQSRIVRFENLRPTTDTGVPTGTDRPTDPTGPTGRNGFVGLRRRS